MLLLIDSISCPFTPALLDYRDFNFLSKFLFNFLILLFLKLIDCFLFILSDKETLDQFIVFVNIDELFSFSFETLQVYLGIELNFLAFLGWLFGVLGFLIIFLTN